jgi:hypothetical protein
VVCRDWPPAHARDDHGIDEDLQTDRLCHSRLWQWLQSLGRVPAPMVPRPENFLKSTSTKGHALNRHVERDGANPIRLAAFSCVLAGIDRGLAKSMPTDNLG